MESMSNPLIQVADLTRVAEFCKKHRLTAVVDNTFASPVLCTPADLGFIVIHSATKFLNGHSDLLAGVVSGPRKFIEKVCLLCSRSALLYKAHSGFERSQNDTLAGQRCMLCSPCLSAKKVKALCTDVAQSHQSGQAAAPSEAVHPVHCVYASSCGLAKDVGSKRHPWTFL